MSGQLKNFMGAYFNPDFYEISGEPQDVVDEFTREEQPAYRRLVAGELRSLLDAHPDDLELEKALHALECAWVAEDKREYRELFERAWRDWSRATDSSA